MATKTRIRPISCPECGYHQWGTRSWWERGLPVCPCGEEMRPDKPADLAWLGFIGANDMPSPMWTQICRENGWEDEIKRKGAAAKAWERNRPKLRFARAGHCVFPGCGLWVSDSADLCSAGHPQREGVMAPEEAIPF